MRRVGRRVGAGGAILSVLLLILTVASSSDLLIPTASSITGCSPASGTVIGSASGGGFPVIGPPREADHFVAHATACDTAAGTTVGAFVSVSGLSGHGAGFYASAFAPSVSGTGRSPQTATITGYLSAGTYQLLAQGRLAAPLGRVWPQAPSGCSRNSGHTVLTCVERTTFTIH